MDRLKAFMRKPAVTGVLASIISCVLGLLLGFVLLMVFDSHNAVAGFHRLITAAFSSPDQFGKLMYTAGPLIVVGLSVGFAFKTGLFNIGATGQYTIGACCALIAGIVFKQPWWVCMLFSMLGGAFWGIFPGLFKALFNVNEVITSIMFNWIGLFAVNVVVSNIPQILSNYYGGVISNRTANLRTVNPSAIIPQAGLDVLFGSNYYNLSIFLAIALALIVHVILNKTVFGYELRACGYNKNAGVYAGINANRCIILSMVISGGLAGIAGSIYYLSGTTPQYVIDKLLANMGFNGIPVALLASSHPIGTIFSAVFISYVQVGGEALQPEYVKETIDIIIASIIYLSAFALLMREMITKVFRERAEVLVVEEPVIAEPEILVVEDATLTDDEDLPDDNPETESEEADIK